MNLWIATIAGRIRIPANIRLILDPLNPVKSSVQARPLILPISIAVVATAVLVSAPLLFLLSSKSVAAPAQVVQVEVAPIPSSPPAGPPYHPRTAVQAFPQNGPVQAYPVTTPIQNYSVPTVVPPKRYKPAVSATYTRPAAPPPPVAKRQNNTPVISQSPALKDYNEKFLGHWFVSGMELNMRFDKTFSLKVGSANTKEGTWEQYSTSYAYLYLPDGGIGSIQVDLKTGATVVKLAGAGTYKVR